MKAARQTILFLSAIALMLSVFVLPASAAVISAAPLKSSVLVNGTGKKFQAYDINGSSYFKLRDIAYVLSGTAKQFQVTFNGIKNEIDLTTNAAYTPVGGEMEVSGTANSAAATPTSYTIFLNGSKLSLAAYTIGVYNYIRLRDIAAAVDFSVRYVAESGAIAIDTSAGYTAALAELNVTMIGDSVGIGVESYLKKHLPKLDNDSKVSRQFYEAYGIVQKLLKGGKLADTVIIELGTNGTIKDSDMRALIELIGSSRKIVFVNTQVPRSWGISDNKTLAKVSAEYPNTIVADWYSASLNQSGYFAKDQIHPSKTGATVLAKVIADAVEKIQ